MLVSVIILNWNGLDYLKDCLDSVFMTNYPASSLEIILVDNASVDGSVAFVKQQYPSVKVIENKINLGFCGGNNMGIQASTGDVIVLLNNDTIVDQNWVVSILDKFKDPTVGIVGCRILYPYSKMIQVLGFSEEFPGFWRALCEGQINHESIDDTSKIDYVQGAAIAILRKTLKKIGLLNSRYESLEDAEWCYRAKKFGLKVVLSNAIVYHFGGISWKRLPSIKRFLTQHKAKHLLILEYYPTKEFIKYFFGYPLKYLNCGISRFSAQETVLQRNNATKQLGKIRTLFYAVRAYLFENFSFLIALLLIITENKKNTAVKGIAEFK